MRNTYREFGLYCARSDNVFLDVLYVLKPRLYCPIIAQKSFVETPIQVLSLVDIIGRNILVFISHVFVVLVLHLMRDGFGRFHLQIYRI